MGSYFGTCTCGVNTHDVVPCDHMAAMVASLRIPQLMQYNVMPYCWQSDQRTLRTLQFPLEVAAECGMQCHNQNYFMLQRTNTKLKLLLLSQLDHTKQGRLT